MRRDRPAASTRAAMRGPPGLRHRRGAACGVGLRRAAAAASGSRPSRPPTPIAHDLAPRRPAARRPAARSTQSKPLTLGERAQPGRPSTGMRADPAEQQQIAGIDRHAEMVDRAAGRRRSPPGSRRAGRRSPRRRRSAPCRRRRRARARSPAPARRLAWAQRRSSDERAAERGEPLARRSPRGSCRGCFP